MAELANWLSVVIVLPDDPGRGKWEHHWHLLTNMTILTYENWHTHPPTCAAFSSTFKVYFASQLELMKCELRCIVDPSPPVMNIMILEIRWAPG